jgi:Na+-transporting methylmalonyl-CoA/oxaloacetate decarboxylase gamma subunit
MKPRNLATRVHARRMGALSRLVRSVLPKDRTDKQREEIATLSERTRIQPVNDQTKKHLAHATEARRSHHNSRAKLTR